MHRLVTLDGQAARQCPPDSTTLQPEANGLGFQIESQELFPSNVVSKTTADHEVLSRIA